jgi:heat shock protein HtpX
LGTAKPERRSRVICQKCGAEYVGGVTLCRSCCAALQERTERLTGGPADLRRSAAGSRTASALLTIAALSSVLVVCFVAAAIGVMITFPLWGMLGLGLHAGLLMTLVIGGVCLLCYLPIVVWTLLRCRGVVLKRASSARPSPAQLRRLHNVTAEMALAAGVPTPEVVVVRGLGANAMAVGDSSRPTIGVSPELLDLLDRQSLQAVIAHEVAHAVNGDLYSTTLLAAIYVRYELLAKWARISSRADTPMSTAGSLDLASVLVYVFRPALRLGWWLARLSGLAAARGREFQADRTAAWLTRDPGSLVTALVTVSEANMSRSGWADDVAHLCVVDPFERQSSSSWLSPHPALSERIERLERLEIEMEGPGAQHVLQDLHA